jgi:hypothetical protein
MHHVLRDPRFRVLLSLELPQEHIVLTGSAPLFAHGLIDDPKDLDVVARGIAWDRATRLGTVEAAPIPPADEVRLFDGKIEILNCWFPDLWHVDELIDSADVVAGIRFARLDVVLRTKRMLNRPKDRHHIKLVEDFLGFRQRPQPPSHT